MAIVPDRFRPYVAALLGMLVTGLGQLYLRRWLRAFAWFALAFGVSVAFVPETAAADVLSGEPVDPVALLPGALVGVASAIDAFILARREVATETGGPRVGGPSQVDATDVGPMTGETHALAGEAETLEATAGQKIDCPACGKPIDPELGFCHWCTTEFATGGTDDANNAN
jgi:hypothetical protein